MRGLGGALALGARLPVAGALLWSFVSSDAAGLQGGVGGAQACRGRLGPDAERAMSYFDTTPQGRVVSHAFDRNGRRLADATSRDVHDQVGWTITGVCVMMALTRGTIIVGLVPAFGVYFRICVLPVVGR